MIDELRLRPLRLEDEHAAQLIHASMLDEGFTFLLGLDEDEPWQRYIRKQDERSRGIGVVEGWVPSSFLLAVVGSDVVGRTSIRHELNDYLALCGGHIGYGVAPAFRRRGYATEILRQSLIIARSKGIDSVLVTCDLDNDASAGVIEKCGGVFESVVEDPKYGGQKRRYWID